MFGRIGRKVFLWPNIMCVQNLCQVTVTVQLAFQTSSFMPTHTDNNFRPSSLPTFPIFLRIHCHPHIPDLRAPTSGYGSQVSDPSETPNTPTKNHVQRRHPPKPRTRIKTRRSVSCAPDYRDHDFVGFNPTSLPTEVTPLLNPVYPESDAETREDWEMSDDNVRRRINNPAAIYGVYEHQHTPQIRSATHGATTRHMGQVHDTFRVFPHIGVSRVVSNICTQLCITCIS